MLATLRQQLSPTTTALPWSTSMSESQKKTVTQFIVETESIRLTNWFIRTAWKTCACLIALTTRLFASIFLAIARTYQRNRFRW
jgi:hypothetical protein